MADDKTLSRKQLEDENRWNHLCNLIAKEAKKQGFFGGDDITTPEENKSGRLVIVGSGIKCAGQFTLEAISHIKNADKVLYCVSDPVTETYICDICPGALDLGVFFDSSKDRYDSCVQMAEACLFFARQGLYTVAVFHGHPGMFTLPSCRIMQVAMKQGIDGSVLPGISVEGCLFADLNIDPSYSGFQNVEATDFLLRKRQLLQDSHVLIQQISCIGEQGYTTKGLGTKNLCTLVKELQKIYGPDYEVVHYYPSQYPTCKPFIDRKPLSEFLKPELGKELTVFSSIYIPPVQTNPIDTDMAVELGLVSSPDDAEQLEDRFCGIYGPREKKAVGDMMKWKVPRGYKHTSRCGAAKYLSEISTNIKMWFKHLKNPQSSMAKYGLSPQEISQLSSNDPRSVLLTVKPGSTSVAWMVATRICTDPSFASAYAACGRQYRNELDGEDRVEQWLHREGYETTPEAVGSALKELQESCFMMRTGHYTTTLPDTVIDIHTDSVHVNSTPVIGFSLSDGLLTWSAGSSNQHNASLQFEQDIFTGKLWGASESEPESDNIRGERQSTLDAHTSNVMEYTINLGIAANNVMMALLKNWRVQKCKGTTDTEERKGAEGPVEVFSEIDKAASCLLQAEVEVMKVNPDYQVITLNSGTAFSRSGGSVGSMEGSQVTIPIPHVPFAGIKGKQSLESEEDQQEPTSKKDQLEPISKKDQLEPTSKK